MTGWTREVTARRASLTLWLAGTGLCGMSCRDKGCALYLDNYPRDADA
jgi:hypothetical protein